MDAGFLPSCLASLVLGGDPLCRPRAGASARLTGIWEEGGDRLRGPPGSSPLLHLLPVFAGAVAGPGDCGEGRLGLVRTALSSSVLGSWTCSPSPPTPPAAGMHLSLCPLLGLLDSGGHPVPLPTADTSVPTGLPCLLGAGLADCLPPALSAPTTQRAGDIQATGWRPIQTSPWVGRPLAGRGDVAEGVST